MNPELQELLKEEFYTQGFPARPAIAVTAPGLDKMMETVGFSYTAMVFLFKDDYLDLKYLQKDLDRLADTVLKKLEENPDYLEEKRQQYDNEVAEFEKDFRKAASAGSLQEKELFSLLQRVKAGLETTGATSHLIEGISLLLEKEIRNSLAKKVSGKELNADFSAITMPITQSFLSKKEEMLWKIMNAEEPQKTMLAEQLASDFFWINANYTGKNSDFTREDALKEASEMKAFKKTDFAAIKKQKGELFKKHGFSEKEKLFIRWAEFLVDWQDDRKEKLYRASLALDCVIREIAKRFGTETKLLNYLLPQEISAEAIKSGEAEITARERIKGCVFIKRIGKISSFCGKDFLELEKKLKKQEEKIDVLTGLPASLGNAIGTAKVVTTLESISKVKQGDILVASMTRPEYVVAMKKAAAIVTDEGGITCHAAIVSRELGIPCVVGTKIATKVLKDGDLVEVRANHGMVRKL